MINKFEIAIGPVRVRNSFKKINLRIKDSDKNFKDYLLGSETQCVAVLNGHDVSGAVKMMCFRRFENVCVLRGSRTLSAATRTGLC